MACFTAVPARPTFTCFCFHLLLLPLLILQQPHPSRAQTNPSEGALRLTGGRTPNEGNVEIFHVGRWGSVCDDEWDEREAQIVCRTLGYPGAIRATYNSEFGLSRRIYWMDNLYCEGHESRLQDCNFDGWGVNDCAYSEAAGVVCKENPAPPRGRRPNAFFYNNSVSTNRILDHAKSRIRLWTNKDVPVRLAGGRYNVEGRVEVKVGDNNWGLICGDGWSLREANVVCRQLGLGFAQAAVQSPYFGGRHADIILTGVSCNSDEKNIADCYHERLGNPDCPGRDENIAGVICAADLPDLRIDEREIERSAYLEDRQMLYLQCAMEENCLSRSAYQINRNDYGWQYEARRLLRFTAKISNVGTTDFRPFLPKHAWQWHMCHLHYHSMEVFAHFDIIDSRGVKVAEGHKASFCLEDNECHSGAQKRYVCANYGDQGITVGCTDIYLHNVDCQWVDITDVPPGNYYLKVSVNPEYKVAELSFMNNAATCNLYYNAIYARVWNCTLGKP